MTGDDGEYQGDPPADALRRLYRGATDPLACGHPGDSSHTGACGWCAAVEDARLAAEERDDLAEQVDRLEARLVDAQHAREQAESMIPAGIAVLDHAALAAHVERLRRWTVHSALCALQVAGEPPCNCGLDTLLASTPAVSLARVQAEALREAVEELRALGLDPSLWGGVMLARADAIERGDEP